MNAKVKHLEHLVRDLVMEVLALVILAGVLYMTQTWYSVGRQRENSKIKLDIAQERMETYRDQAEDDKSRYDDFDQAKADALSFYYDRNPEAGIYGMTDRWGISEVYLLNAQNKVEESNQSQYPDFKGDPQFASLLETGEPITVGNMRYYASRRERGGFLIAGRESAKEIALEQEKLSPEYALHNIKVGNTGSIVALDKTDGTVVYDVDPQFIGQSADSLGLDKSKLVDGYDGWISRGKDSFYVQVRAIGEQYLFIAIVPKAEINAYNLKKVGLLLSVFFLVITLIVIYAHFLRQDQAKLSAEQQKVDYIQVGKHLYFNKNIFSQCKNILVLGLIVIFLSSYYIQSLLALSAQTVRSENKLTAIETIFDDNEDKYKQLKDEYTAEYVGRAENIASMLGADPTLVNDSSLTELAKRAQIRSIYVFDENGKVVSTNSNIKDFQLSNDETEQSYPFWDVVRGYTDVLAQDATVDRHSDTGYTQYIGVKRIDAVGMVQLGISPKRLERRLQSVQKDVVLENIAVENNGYSIMVNGEDKTLTFFPNRKLIGSNISEIGLSETACKDEYVGYQTINNQKCFTSCMEYNGQFVFVVVPVTEIGNGLFALSVLATIVSFLLLLLITVPLLLSKEEKEESDSSAGGEQGFRKEPKGMINVTSSSGKTRRVQSIVGRWDGTSALSWEERSAEQKLKTVLGVFMGILAVLFVWYFYQQRAAYDRTSILSYIVHRKWEKAPNIFSFTYIAIVSVEVLMISWVIREVLKATFISFGARAETVGRLLRSFVKYISVIGLVFYGLSFVGVDSQSMLASAGIFTLVVGLGAQSLISDIIAGIFIVFEGEFRVGDIVTIGDWRGTVLEIGIRSTKVEDAAQNIKIINNSAISNVINMTKKYSYASCDVGIEYGESLERVESILQLELPKVKAALPAIEAGPFYKGVVALADSSVNIKIVAQCKEKDRVQLCRDLNRQMKLIFDKHNVNIPFPQVVLNQPPVFQDATFLEQRQAAQFVENQKEQSKDINLSENDS